MMLHSAAEIRRAVAAREVTAVEVCRTSLARIERLNGQLNAFITVDAGGALRRAAELDARHADLSALPLLGVPFAAKDNICTRGLRTTAGSRILDGYVPPYDATVIERLHAAGAVLVGKTNCDEFAMGSSTEHSAYGVARNPWAVDRIPGGSSGGSAIAVATRSTPLALGSETGGSVRQPAALCGVLGLKPTYGRVSRYGLMAFGSSLDQVAPFATTVSDIALVLQALAGPDRRDASCHSEPPADYAADLLRGIRDVRVGVPRALLTEGVEEGVARAFELALDELRAAGARIVDVALPNARYAIPAYTIVGMAEASSNLSRYDGVRYGHRAADASSLSDMYVKTRAAFGAEVKRRVMLGTYVLSGGYYDAFYTKAQQVRALLRQDYERAFEVVDVIAMPTSPTTAFPLGARLEDPVQMYLADVFTVSANLTGLPAISVPCGFAERLPVGLQLTGRAWDEGMLLRVAADYERRTDWTTVLPPAAGSNG
jgi:aspartyl-tRNA(Asn)/glutamyl-tRNA(Gln) amidotransferase subunit A